MIFARRALFVAVALWSLAACHSGPSLPLDGSIPEWLRKFVSESGGPPPVIEKATYKGLLAYNLTATDRADTGDKHALFSGEGKLICRYGGFVGQVTSGSCDLDKIVYVSTLYAPKKR